MSVAATPHAMDERLLLFEVAGALYALPIARVIEVAEIRNMACIPTLPTAVGGVINYHGDALPVIRRATLLGVDESSCPEPQHVLVVTGQSGRSAELGVLVDRVLGLTDGRAATALGADPVAERRPIDGRVAGVLDAQRLVTLAREVIEGSLGRSEQRGRIEDGASPGRR